MSRSCGTCELCCIIPSVPVIDKPAGRRCFNLAPNRGCSIYGRHPAACQAFRCRWLDDETLDEAWKPEVSHLLIPGGQSTRIWVKVDADHPNAWLEPKYYAALKSWSRDAVQVGGEVVVRVGDATTLILPDEDLELGALGGDDFVMITYQQASEGRQPVVQVIRRDGDISQVIGRVIPDQGAPIDGVNASNASMT